MQDITDNITYHTPDIFVGETEKKSPTFSDDVNVAVSEILDLSQKSLHNFNQKTEFIKETLSFISSL